MHCVGDQRGLFGIIQSEDLGQGVGDQRGLFGIIHVEDIVQCAVSEIKGNLQGEDILVPVVRAGCEIHFHSSWNQI